MLTFMKLLFLRLRYNLLLAQIAAMQEDLAGRHVVEINQTLDLHYKKGQAVMCLQEMNRLNQMTLKRGVA